MNNTKNEGKVIINPITSAAILGFEKKVVKAKV